ncbi:multidrug ABC transporter ATP-binding protein [Paenibacillus sp. J31TS4]|uniref:ABC transporter ATP-binding protein n=1 Tax=Paenibacillus sp. J31TS4 TaxID=2807195 RepID=UPI001B25306C|nr:ABC transporter ATP-binding protein [Paenibacillus sp. J31TS4]GIP41051.1 multidrug ABC transporter ATP-binding protein [Paenibacillus sp. J31TS4]
MEKLQVELREAGYPDRSAVVSDVAFTVREGEWVGLIGPNGAGKSTTIKAILGLLGKREGTVVFSGPYSYIPEHPVLYEHLTLWEHLELAAAVWELEPEAFRADAERLLARFRLTEVRHHLPGSFSKGMQQKIMLLVAFLQKPDVYIVDEPFIGLDPRAVQDLIELLEEERQRGAGILMSTHVLDTAERLCDTFLLLDKGRLVAQGTMDELRLSSGLPGASLFDCFLKLT